MRIPPKYQLTSTIVKLLQEITTQKTTLDLLPQDKISEKFSRQKSILKSAVYSARIEGNPYTPEEAKLLSLKNPHDVKKIELANLYQSLEYVLNHSWNKALVASNIKELHTRIMKGLSPEVGRLRQEPSAIFNTAGI